jgi:cysteine desulfurase/selenocysteine lyase
MSDNIKALRTDFSILNQVIHGESLVYFDNASTTQKPNAVIRAMDDYYFHDNANVHRAVHSLSVRATQLFESAREKIKRFIHANSSKECIFVRGTTEAINLVAQSFVAPRILPGEEILITHMEHHSNIVPWQMVCKKTGAVLRVAPVTIMGEIDLAAFEALLSEKTKFVAISHASNALGTINAIEKMIAMAHAVGALVLVDGAQAPAHLPVNVKALDCDFYAFSAHKMYGPTGIGVLWGRETLLDATAPYQGGGEMISSVTLESFDYASLPQKFEAGTPDIAGAIGLGAAIDYLLALDWESVAQHEADLLAYATGALCAIKGFNIVGEAPRKVPVLSFVHGKIHAHDIGTILDSMGVAVRSGHHCTMPLMDFFQVAATTRLSFSFYNTREEIDRCMNALIKVKELLG